jgi:hypothetical protein
MSDTAQSIFPVAELRGVTVSHHRRSAVTAAPRCEPGMISDSLFCRVSL